MRDAPPLSETKQTEQTARAERLAQALRENLHRRKAQARARVLSPAPEPPPPHPAGDKPPA